MPSKEQKRPVSLKTNTCCRQLSKLRKKSQVSVCLKEKVPGRYEWVDRKEFKSKERKQNIAPGGFFATLHVLKYLGV